MFLDQFKLKTISKMKSTGLEPLAAYTLMANWDVARRFQTNHQITNRIRERYRRTGLFKDMPHSGLLKVTTRAEYPYIIMLWVRISATAKTDLVFIEGNLNSQRYYAVPAPFLRWMPVTHPIFQTSSSIYCIVNKFLCTNNVNKKVLRFLKIYHVQSMLGISFGELFRNAWSKTAHSNNFSLS